MLNRFKDKLNNSIPVQHKERKEKKLKKFFFLNSYVHVLFSTFYRQWILLQRNFQSMCASTSRLFRFEYENDINLTRE